MTLLVLTLVLTFAGYFVQSRNTVGPAPKWKQIRLMRSTRTEVEKLLGRSKYRGYFASYKVDGGLLRIEYYPFNSCGQSGADFRVRRWTVVEITYEPDDPPMQADLNLDLKKLRKVAVTGDVLGVISYVNDEDGVDYMFHDETLNNMRYFPGKRYDYLRCKNSTENRR